MDKLPAGLHLIGDLYNCAINHSLMSDLERLKLYCIQLVKESGLTCVGEKFVQFGEGGVTGTVVLAESHLCIHCWPENNFVTVDVYVCNYTQDNRQKAKQLFDDVVSLFMPENKKVQQIDR